MPQLQRRWREFGGQAEELQPGNSITWIGMGFLLLLRLNSLDGYSNVRRLTLIPSGEVQSERDIYEFLWIFGIRQVAYEDKARGLPGYL